MPAAPLGTMSPSLLVDNGIDAPTDNGGAVVPTALAPWARSTLVGSALFASV
ncbi:hypothetical protein [Natronomonas sp. LN261]|jgi:hypothetical protein|uniref:hypothetical protein n=1 Tax=Natronomonas sp. LN261 TaxID=2750669 RepID=UPI001C679308|nr:hypothetical protein [Natronomonas sp. LN261]